MRLRLTHQTRQLVAGEKPDNFLLMSSLSKIERVTIREIFRVIEAYQKRISVVFAGVMSI
jgi:CBS domain-containing protein